jgi:sortase A
MVLMGHNYVSHFGKLSNLQLGDVVRFTDMDGAVIEYAVVGKDLLPAAAVEEMTSGDFDLTLFTCNYSGKSRVTIYCDRTDH